MTRFDLTNAPIPEVPLLPANLSAGAVSAFVGYVRDHNEGRPVRRLEYEAYPELAQKEGERIVGEALGRFPILDARCRHRTGVLELGDVAIRVEAAGAHRAEAIRACEWIVEEVKRRVPIWKKEHYADGDSGWVNATTPGHAEVTSDDYYRRQASLAEVGSAGQASLADLRILVVGAGGLGCPALAYLAGAGVGHLTVVDPDRVEASNLHRQVLFGIDDLGMAKAVAAARRLRALNPFITANPIEAAVTASNAVELVAAHDLVLDGTDRLATKFLLNRVCVALGKPLLVASVHRFEGQLQLVRPGGPCLECLWPEPPADGCVGTCAEVGVLGVTPGVLGTLQATEAIKWRLGLPGPVSDGSLLLFDLLSLRSQTLRLPRRADCPVCGPSAEPLRGIEEIELAHPDLGAFEIVDIREPDEVEADPLAGVPNRPLSTWTVPEGGTRPLLLVCARGVRSGRLARQLREAGYAAYSLRGGAEALRRRL
jgi:adenylyltransferase/sulfurtransferase